MADFTLANALMSAGIAALTTLGVEFAAKPALEARKERILHGHRNRRDIAQKLVALETKITEAPVHIITRGVGDVLPELVEANDALSSDRVWIRAHCPPAIIDLFEEDYVARNALFSGTLILHATFMRNPLMQEPPAERRELEQYMLQAIWGSWGHYLARSSNVPIRYLRTSSGHVIKLRRLEGAAKGVLSRRVSVDAQLAAAAAAAAARASSSAKAQGAASQRS
ncbi:MAG TPA: hypothetical protein VFG33_10735 [Kribbella sp.]|uniref:hypothetical protein n=1 Tax=Kribbella sp. TaxID=1871183 RepID=UPI002D76C3BD|nr:hypothetical protein [Kribbella sp.]HET6293846.1 hypothetical protein [Kribbella sp.]